MTVKWGIVGAGDIAARNVVPGLKLAPSGQPWAVVSRDFGKASAFAQAHDIPKAYASLSEMLADPSVDAVYIATPNHLHASQAIEAARAGKHVLCDKPMALTEADAAEMIRASLAHQVRLGVVFQNRYHPAHAEARKQVASGVLGDIELVRAQLCVGRARGHWKGWRTDAAAAGSGAIVGQALHPIDILRFIMDTEVDEVRSMTDESPPERPVDDMSYSLLRFENGAHGTVVAGTMVPNSDNDVVIYGSRAKLVCTATLGTQRPGVHQTFLLEGDVPTIRLDFSNDTSHLRFSRQIEDFNQSILGGGPCLTSGENGLQMTRIAAAMLQSSRNGTPVRLGGVG